LQTLALRCHDLTHTMIVRILEQCTQLQHLKILAEPDSLEEWEDGVNFDLTVTTNIRHLTLGVGKIFPYLFLGLNTIKMPQLTTMELEGTWIRDGPFAVPAVLKFLNTTHATKITSLSITDVEMSSDDCISLLIGLPGLTQFSYKLLDERFYRSHPFNPSF